MSFGIRTVTTIRFHCPISDLYVRALVTGIFSSPGTPLLSGIEKIASKTGFPVFFLKVDKVARGYYEAEFILLEEEPAQTKPYEITRRHIRLLEEIIREKPELWLWSHRRWKHKRLAEEILPD
jgi:KDO2-lipid IV(A) lauroyltransferase